MSYVRLSFTKYLKYASLLYLINFICIYYYPFTLGRGDVVKGYFDSRFSSVVQIFKSVKFKNSFNILIFRNNYASGYEREGSALAIYHRGEEVVNIWGGYADRSKGKKWTSKTVTPIFSATQVMKYK